MDGLPEIQIADQLFKRHWEYEAGVPGERAWFFELPHLMLLELRAPNVKSPFGYRHSAVLSTIGSSKETLSYTGHAPDLAQACGELYNSLRRSLRIRGFTAYIH
jgi:hypothetical protein